MADSAVHVRDHEGIVTPEGVVLSFVEAGIASRAIALVLDILIRAIAVFVIAWIAVAYNVGWTTTIILITVATFSALLVYPVVFEATMRGKTPGKMALGIRVATIEGGPVRFRHALVRAALALIEILMTAGVVALVTALTNRRGQRLGDIVAGTMVVRDRSALGSDHPVAFHPPFGWESFAKSVDTSAIGSELSLLIRDFLIRAESLSLWARWRIGNQLAEDVAQRTGTSLPPGAHPEAFLTAVLAAHQHVNIAPEVAAGVPVAGPPTYQPPSMPVLPADELSETWGS